jgi:SAM-dependent methyltransferase
LSNASVLNGTDPANIDDPFAITFTSTDNYQPQEIAARLGGSTWYHRIRIGEFVTPGRSRLAPIWSIIRKSRSYLNYHDKRVLDLGSWDGLWAFEAEHLGASEVIATEIQIEPFQNFLNCREIIGSRVLPFYNVSPYNLTDRLDVVLNVGGGDTINGFDIVQYMGILYHLRDPLLALSQIRSVLAPGGKMLLETAAIIDETNSHMAYNHDGSDQFRLYTADMTTWWVPTIKCLRDMLRSSMFDVVEGTVSQWGLPGEVGRIALVAVPADRAESPVLRGELAKLDRNPGLLPHVFRARP